MVKRPSPKIIFLFLGLLSVLWWGFLVVEALQYTPTCSPGDQFCASAQTVYGDFAFSTAFALMFLVPVWAAALIIYATTRSIKERSSGARAAIGFGYVSILLLGAALLITVAWL